MFEVSILIPMKSNEGINFSTAQHIAFESFISDHFDAFTRMPFKVSGSWAAPSGEIMSEDSLVYVIGVETIRAGASIWEVARFAKAHYSQQAIYIRYLGYAEVV